MIVGLVTMALCLGWPGTEETEILNTELALVGTRPATNSRMFEFPSPSSSPSIPCRSPYWADHAAYGETTAMLNEAVVEPPMLVAVMVAMLLMVMVVMVRF